MTGRPAAGVWAAAAQARSPPPPPPPLTLLPPPLPAPLHLQMDATQDVEKKLGLSLDELIAQQKAKQLKKPAGSAGKKKGAARVSGSGWRWLVLPW